MIVVNLIGGLGNQMFQYACGRSLSLLTGQPLRLAVDQFAGYRLHQGFELNRVFRVDAPTATTADLRRLLGWRRAPAVRRLLGKPGLDFLRGGNWFNEPHLWFTPSLLQQAGPRYLQGYWQSENYFLSCIDVIRADLVFRLPADDADQAVLAAMRAQPSASLHVRRGDYLKLRNRRLLAECGLDYYRRAVARLREQVPGVRLFAFSDDPDWVRASLCGELGELGELDVVHHNTGPRSALDMRLMAAADHHIIANSSFSWWGAWLNPSPGKIVIAPRRWYVNAANDRDLVPCGWQRV